MAWTTSACLRARPSLTALTFAGLKPARRMWLAMQYSSSHRRPALMLAVGAICLGAAAPVLPSSLLAAVLLTAGIAVAVVGAGANIAGSVRSARTSAAASSVPEQALLTAGPTHSPAAEAPQKVAPAKKVARSQYARPVAPNHDWAELMSRINHELRTPLNAVIGFSEVMALEMFGPMGNERYQEYVRHIRDSADDLLKSAEDTLALTALLHQRADVTPSANALEDAIEDAWTFLERKAASRDVGLEVVVPPDVEVMSEPRALRQVLVNVLSEAIARTVEGANVKLLAVGDGELVEIVVSVSGLQHEVMPRAGSLAISLARTLLEMQGTSLLEIESAGGGWSAVTVLDRAAQPDFFAAQSHTSAQAWRHESVASF
ncbi:histidine kinase [Hyphomicrobium sp. 1Nfss2.1]|uniref:sensor histidine kinase n=1 Tax=Hyphomicrobium sp. 1Nfss2.1 TaxID=3413936 RepID=UPI003C7ED598